MVLETSVIVEIFRPQPDPRVVSWLESLTGEVATTSVTVAEVLDGVRHLRSSRGRATLSTRIRSTLQLYRDTRSVLAFDAEAARHYPEVLAARERVGLPISMADAQIASICRAHGAICATRNTRNFDHTGVALFNPWAL